MMDKNDQVTEAQVMDLLVRWIDTKVTLSHGEIQREIDVMLASLVAGGLLEFVDVQNDRLYHVVKPKEKP